MAAFDSAERASFADSVGRFVTDRYDFDRYRALRATPEGYGREEWQAYADLGWLALPFAAEAGGLGGGAEETAIVMEAIGRGLLLEPFLASIVLGGGLVDRCGTAGQIETLVPTLTTGETVLAFAHNERDAGDAIDLIRASVSVGPDGYRLSGRKTLVLHGDVATRLVVSARIEDEAALSLFLVDPGAAGVSVEPHRLIDGRGFAEISFVDAATERLGAAPAEAAIRSAVDGATVAICAEAVGAMEVLNAATLAYAKTRQQFGRPIGNFQALQHRLVDMAVAEQEARSITRAAARALDASHPGAALVISAAKLCINRAGRFIGESAIQLHGAIAMTEELSVGHYFKRLLTIGSLFSDTDEHLDRIAGSTA